MINTRDSTGIRGGDRILQQLARNIRGAVDDKSGLCGRREADRFLVFCRHLEDPEAFLRKISLGLGGGDGRKLQNPAPYGHLAEV
ncbi:MAG: hypothetical protein K6E83_03960 [Clostridium sp.]|nr:hypothetical protein [Clostridium sp.]